MILKNFFRFLSSFSRKRVKPENRRRSERIPVSAAVKYTVVNGAGEKIGGSALVNYARNISEVGLCLITYEPLEKGTRLDLRVTLTAYAVLEIQGVVVWQSRFVGDDDRPRFSTGVCFGDLKPRLQRKLQRYLRHIVEMPVAPTLQNFIPL